MTFAEFDKKYPAKAVRTGSGASFRCRYCKNDASDRTVALLVGTVGISDVFFEHFDLLAGRFSVLTMDYPMELKTCAALADGIAELFTSLGIEKAWLCGQSLGGFLAQIIAVRHPGRVEGFILSNSASLAADMGKDAESFLMQMAEKQKKNRDLVSILPMNIVKRTLFSTARSIADAYTEEQSRRSALITSIMEEQLTRGYLRHMLALLTDLPSYYGMVPAQFKFLRGRVLLIFAPDDTLFTEPCRDSLVALMPSPAVDRSFTGGHMAIFLDPYKYSETVGAFIAI